MIDQYLQFFNPDQNKEVLAMAIESAEEALIKFEDAEEQDMDQ